MATAFDTLFDRHFLQQLEALTLASRQLMRTRMKAERRSSARGSSVEFAEYRPFTDGDDLRYIDWNAFARWRQLVLKLFVEEEDLYLHCLLDASVSMRYGSPVTKYDYARRTVAGLSYLGLSNMDRVSVVPLGSDPLQWWLPSRGKNRFLLLLRYLAAAEATTYGAGLSLETTVRKWLNLQPHRGLVIVVSDLWGQNWGDARNALDRLRYARHEVAIIQVRDPAEEVAGQVGEYELSDLEYGGKKQVIIDQSIQRQYAARFAAYQTEILAWCRKYQVPLIQVNTQVPVLDLLMKSLIQGGFIR
jgi:uncharacterized protein (DUF58 family)